MKALNVGCNYAANPETPGVNVEWTRLDIDPGVKPDVVHDMRVRLPEELRGKFDIVWCSHMLEHVGWREVEMVFGHLVEAVAPGGKLMVVVPDLQWACKRILSGVFDFGVLGVLYGGQVSEPDFHRNGFTPSTLKMLAERAGLKVSGLNTSDFTAIVNGIEYHPHQIYLIAERP